MSDLTDGDGSNDANSSVIVTYTGSTDFFGEGALDVPGATVEVVETDPHPLSTSAAAKECKKGAPAYRQRLLLKYVRRCTLLGLYTRGDGLYSEIASQNLICV